MTRHFGMIRALALAALVLVLLQWAQARQFERLEARIWWAELRAEIWEGPK
jgi:hypothetical protein